MSRGSQLRRAGFTLIEVMLALAILGLGLTVLIKSVANNVNKVGEAHMMGVVAELGRGQMYELEEKLQKEGFTENDQSTKGDFADQGWPGVTWDAKIEVPEIPSFAQLQAAQQAQAKAGAGAGSGSDGKGAGSGAEGGLGESGLAGMLSMLGAGGGSDAADAAGASFIQSQFEMVQQVLKSSIRKVTLVIDFQVMGSKRQYELVAYFTDANGMDKVLGGLGTQSPTPPPGGN